MRNSKQKWFKLDNAAKIFPPTSNKKDPKVFRFACELNEEVDPIILQKALDETMTLFPGYRVVLKRGLFWYYLETTKRTPIVKEEKIPPCSPIYEKDKKRLLFRINYYHRRINLELYHALADGTGALEFLKTLVCIYLTKKHKDALPEDFVLDYDASQKEKMDDSFHKYYNKKLKTNPLKEKNAHQIKLEHLEDNRFRIIEGYLSVKEVRNLAHQYHVSLTILLTAIYTLAIGETMTEEEKKKPITITIPVNLRQYFKSITARNFFSVINVSHQVDEKETLETVITDIKNKFEFALKKENLQGRINELIKLEHNFIVRFVPLFIKDLILKIAYHISEKKVTSAISNLGQIKIQEPYQKYIKRFDIFVSTNKQQICLCSYLDELTITFSSAYVSNDIIKNFFRKLSELGLKITIVENPLEE